MSARSRGLRALRALRWSLRLPEPDGLAAGVALAAANVLGVGAVACAAGAVPTVPDAPSTTAPDDARPVSGPPVPDQRPHAADRREKRR